jgi:hypothetical protein
MRKKKKYRPVYRSGRKIKNKTQCLKENEN